MSWSSIKKSCRPLHDKDDRDYITGCMKKQRFPTREAAQRALAKLSKKTGKEFNSYDCRFCNGVHNGSYNEAAQ